MKRVRLIGSAAQHVVLVRSATGGITELSANSGVWLVKDLMDRASRMRQARGGVGLVTTCDVYRQAVGSIFLGEEHEGVIVLKERLGDRAASSRDRGHGPKAPAGLDLVVVHGGEPTKNDRAALIAAARHAGPDRWMLLNATDPTWTVGLPRAGADHRVVMITADALRRSGAAIGKGRSWDESFIHLISFFHGDGSKLLRDAHHVLVRFGSSGLVCANRVKEHIRCTAFFVPAEIEEDQAPTKGFGQEEVFLARLIMELLRPALRGRERGPVDPASRLHFAAREALRSVHRKQISGWRSDGNDLVASADVFAFNKEPNDPIAGADITDLVEHGSLLRLATHDSPSTLLAWAIEHVRTGANGLLGATPVVAFGGVVSVDRDEIEQYRAIRDKVIRYVAGPGEKPMSLGVFGPPGSGKTFGVEQIRNALGDAVTWIPIDFSGLTNAGELAKEFRAIRDENLKGRIPFVLFDEFDATLEGVPYGWLQHFLRPVENGVFRADAADHPVGRGIFVFTGGTCHSFAEFRAKSRGGEPPDAAAELLARERKMPDMARRLLDHIDVKGISAVPGEPAHLFLVRRAIVLRKQLLARMQKDPSASIDVDQRLLVALLTLQKYHNGTSSMCKLLARLRPSREGRILSTSLPPVNELDAFLEPNALKRIMNRSHRLQHAIEPLARLIHENWRATLAPGVKKEADVPWERLPEHYRDSNRMQAHDMTRKLEAMGYRWEQGPIPGQVVAFSDEQVEVMARMEHDRWVKEKLATGWTHGPRRDDRLRIHPLLIPYDELNEKDKDLDRDPVRKIPGFLAKVGYAVVKNGE